MRTRVLARPLIIEQQESLIQKQSMQRKFLQRIAEFKKDQMKKARYERKKVFNENIFHSSTVNLSGKSNIKLERITTLVQCDFFGGTRRHGL